MIFVTLQNNIGAYKSTTRELCIVGNCIRKNWNDIIKLQ